MSKSTKNILTVIVGLVLVLAGCWLMVFTKALGRSTDPVSEAWTSCMGLGGVFLFFGGCWLYLSPRSDKS